MLCDTTMRGHNHWPHQRYATICLVNEELARGRTKFPGFRFTFAGLIEEVGELAEAILDGDKRQARLEAGQVAAIAIRIAEELDDADYQHSPLVCAMVGLGRIAKAILQRKHDAALIDPLLDSVHRLKLGDATFDDITDMEAQP